MGFTSYVDSSDVIRFLEEIWTREGYPEELVIDHRRHLVNMDYLHCYGIPYRRSSLTGFAVKQLWMERLDLTFKSWLKEGYAGTSIQGHLSNHNAAYRATPHCSKGPSISELMHVRWIRLQLPVIATREVGQDVM